MIRRWFFRQKLNVKFTLVIGLLLFVPITIISVILFRNQKQTSLEKALESERVSIERHYEEIKKITEMCNLQTQFFIGNQPLKEFLIRLKNQEEIATEELVDFYKNDISMLERLVNSNPYIYQIRVYAENDNFSEMMPILFQHKRMQELAWGDSFSPGEWQFNYPDDILEGIQIRTANHVMSLVTPMTDYENGEIGILEVAVDMEQVFPRIFSADEAQWECFVDKNGNIYTGNDSDTSEKWNQNSESILAKVRDRDVRKPLCEVTEIEGETVILSCVSVQELSGYLVSVLSMEQELRNISNQQFFVLFLIGAFFVILLFGINGVVNLLLKRFYGIVEVIRQVRRGNLSGRIQDCGTDEVGELGIQVNRMLDRIEKLVEENVNREILAKNSEIRALQNQINAHFIYNVLESIKMMAELEEKYDISDAVTSLGKLLRYSMRWVSGNVLVGQEIDYIKNYLNLINLRFDYCITLSLNIPDIAMSQEIPKMTLQPIVENAIVHGIEELAEDATIYMKCILDGKDLLIEITDSGKGMTTEEVETLEKKIKGEIEVKGSSGNGIGLKNVQDRIQIEFGEAYGISVHSKEGCYTKVVVKIPIAHGGENNENINGG